MTADGTKMSSTQSALLKIQFSRDYSAEVDCVLVDNLHSCMILGLDLLKSITITQNSSHVILNGNTLPTISKHDFSFPAYPSENTSIPPYSYKRVSLRISRQFTASTIAIENLKQSKRKINVETSLQAASTNPFVIIRNNSPTSLQISRNQPICTIQEIEVDVVNGVTKMLDLAAEKEEMDQFQSKRENRAEKIGFIPPIKSLGSLDEDQREEVNDLIQNYRLAFTMADDDLGKLGYYRFTIPMIDESDTSYIPPRPVPIGLREKVENEISTWKQLGIIAPTQSGFNTPLIILKKGDGSIRISLDARNLNSKIRPDRFPLPSMADIFSKLGERLSGSKNCYISQFDLSRGYWRFKLAITTATSCHFLIIDGTIKRIDCFMGSQLGQPRSAVSWTRSSATTSHSFYILMTCLSSITTTISTWKIWNSFSPAASNTDFCLARKSVL